MTMTLDENDFLTFQLYTASKTPRIKKARIKGWIWTTIAFSCLAYLFYSSDNSFIGNLFLIYACLSALFFPLFTRWRYKKHYLKYIRDTYKNRFNEKCEIEFNDDNIVTRDKTGELKINKAEIEEINEIQGYYFLKCKTGATLIVSKDKTADVEQVKNEIRAMVERGVKHNIELDWRWK
jgi:hypothetical protein